MILYRSKLPFCASVYFQSHHKIRRSVFNHIFIIPPHLKTIIINC